VQTKQSTGKRQSVVLFYAADAVKSLTLSDSNSLSRSATARDVNHLVSGVKEGQVNPLYDPESKLDMMLTKYVRDIMTRTKN
jgi:hypothetical protein